MLKIWTVITLTLLNMQANANTCTPPEASNVCSGQTVVGVSGSANCIQAQGLGSVATAAKICNTYYGFNNLAQTLQGSNDCSVQGSVLTNPNNNFSPTSINSLQAWYAADAIVGINSTLNNSETVTSWIDISGNSRHFTTQTSSQAPTYVSSQPLINSKPTVSFQGSDFLTYAFNGKDILRNAPGTTIVFVTKVDQITSYNVMMNISVGGSSNARFYLTRNYSTNGNIRLGGRRLDSNSFQDVTSSAYGADYYILTLSINYQNQTLKIYVDSTLDAQNNSFQTSGNTSNTDSSSVTLGQSGTNAGYFNGEVAELLIFNEDITDSDNQSAIECYLSEKYNITVSANCP